MKELQDENRGLLQREQESLISRQLAEQERDKATQALDAALVDADRQTAEMLAKMGAESDQAAQQIATLQASLSSAEEARSRLQQALDSGSGSGENGSEAPPYTLEPRIAFSSDSAAPTSHCL